MIPKQTVASRCSGSLGRVVPAVGFRLILVCVLLFCWLDQDADWRWLSSVSLQNVREDRDGLDVLKELELPHHHHIFLFFALLTAHE